MVGVFYLSRSLHPVTWHRTPACVDLVFSFFRSAIQSKSSTVCLKSKRKIEHKRSALQPSSWLLFISTYFRIPSMLGRTAVCFLSWPSCFVWWLNFYSPCLFHLPAPPPPHLYPPTHTLYFFKCKDENTTVHQNPSKASFLFGEGHSFWDAHISARGKK